MSNQSSLTIRPGSAHSAPAFTPYFVLSLVYLVGILTGLTPLADATRPLLIPALVLAFGLTLMSRRDQGLPNPTPLAAALTLGGLVLSWAGDIALGPSFEFGLGFFLLAQLCYIAAFWMSFHKPPSLGNVFTVVGGVLFVVSDSMLAFRLFTTLFQSPPEDAVIMLGYLLAQAFIVIGMLRSMPAEPASAPGNTPAFDGAGA